MTIACRRLWIGTGNGIIISVPLTDSKSTTRCQHVSMNTDIFRLTDSPATANSSSTKPGSVVRVYDQPVSNYIPYCSMNHAQLSFHGYRDAVKFFVAVPGQPPSKILHDEETNSEALPTTSSTLTSNDNSSIAFGDILVVSGGDGYIDFRIGDSSTDKTDEVTNQNNRNMSYLIVWHLGSI